MNIGQHLFEPTRTAAVVLGASGWNDPTLAGGEAFANSARAMLTYITARKGLRVPKHRVLNLFDDEASAPEQLGAISEFLVACATTETPVSAVIIYYIGHGAFGEWSRRFFVLLRASDPSYEDSGISMAALAQRLRDATPYARRVLFIDCCFAGAAAKEFMGADTGRQAATTSTMSAFDRGAALLCSSAPDAVSIAPPGASHTMFSGALLSVLKEGVSSIRGTLTLKDIHYHTRALLVQRHAAKAVLPVLHEAQQEGADLLERPAFPNPAHAEGQPSREVEEAEAVEKPRRDATQRESKEKARLNAIFFPNGGPAPNLQSIDRNKQKPVMSTTQTLPPTFATTEGEVVRMRPLLHRAGHLIMTAWRVLTTRRALLEMDARMLKDIGVSRAQATHEATRGVWHSADGMKKGDPVR